MTSPALTGEWEHKLRKIEDGEDEPRGVHAEISTLTQDFVSEPLISLNLLIALNKHRSPRPFDGETLYEGLNFYQDLEGFSKISKSIAGRRLELTEVEPLSKIKN